MSSMRRLARFAAADCNVLVYDRRGYAGSAEVGAPYTVNANVDDLCCILNEVSSEESFGVKDVYLFGHSLGGVVAVGASIKYAVKAIAVYEMPVPWLENAVRTANSDNLVETVTDPGQFAERFMRRMVGDKVWERLPEATKDLRRSEGGTLRSEMIDIRVEQPWNPAQVLTKIVVGYGERTVGHHVKNSQMVSTLFPNARLVELRDGRHGAHLADPQQLYEMVIRPILD